MEHEPSGSFITSLLELKLDETTMFPSPPLLETLVYTKYITHICCFTKWHHPSRNVRVGDVVLIREDSAIPTKWPLARVIQAHPGKDNLVRVATVKISTGVRTRPVVKLAVLLPSSLVN